MKFSWFKAWGKGKKKNKNYCFRKSTVAKNIRKPPDDVCPSCPAINSENYVTIFESELNFITANANLWDNLETGGELYGFLSHEGNLIILFATPPGKAAIHNAICFKQDYMFFQKASLLLFNHFSLQFMGNFHSHHYLSLKKLSRTDIRNLNTIARKNIFKQLAQFLVTFEKHPKPANSYSTGKKCEHNHKRLTKISSYFYADAINGQPIECKIKIIPGISPIRQAIENNSDLKSELIEYYGKTKDRILYNEYNIVPSKKHRSLPHAIRSQIELFLGENNLAGTCVIDGDSVVLRIGLFQDLGFLFIVYDIHTPHNIQSVLYQNDKKSRNPVNISDEILVNNQAKISLNEVYSLYKKLVIKQFS